MNPLEISADEATPRKRYALTTCGLSGKLTREGSRAVFVIYLCAVAVRLLVKLWGRIEKTGAPSFAPMLLVGAAAAAAAAGLTLWRLARREEYWPVFIGGAVAFASFFRFDDQPIAARTVLEKPLIVLALVPAAFATWAFLGMIRETDELERRINYQALAFGFGVTFALTLVYSVLEDLGLPRISSVWWWLALAVFWAVGITVYARKYR